MILSRAPSGPRASLSWRNLNDRHGRSTGPEGSARRSDRVRGIGPPHLAADLRASLPGDGGHAPRRGPAPGDAAARLPRAGPAEPAGAPAHLAADHRPERADRFRPQRDASKAG